jgi:hypothetical protein
MKIVKIIILINLSKIERLQTADSEKKSAVNKT